MTDLLEDARMYDAKDGLFYCDDCNDAVEECICTGEQHVWAARQRVLWSVEYQGKYGHMWR